MMNILTYFLFLITASFFFISCSPQQDVLKVGVSPVVSSSAIFIAKEKGYFEEFGLRNVEIVPFNKSGPSMTALLASNELHVGGGNISSGLWNAIASGQVIRLVADKGHIEKDKSYIGLLVRKDHVESGRFKTLVDLKGFKLGLTGLDGVSQQIVVDRFLKKVGLSMKDVTFVKMSYGEMNIALENKSLDATVQLEPYLSKAIMDNIAVQVAPATEVHPYQQSAAIFYGKRLLENKEEGIAFMAAYLKAVQDYEKAFVLGIDKNEIVSLLKKYIKIDNDRLWTSMIPVGLNLKGFLDINALEEDLNWYQENGFVSQRPDLNQIIDNSFVEQALKRL